MLFFEYIKSLPLTTILSIYAAILATVTATIQVINLIKNLKKEVVKLTVSAERDCNSLFAKRRVNLVVISFLVTNHSSFPITVNKVGFCSKDKSLVDMAIHRLVFKQNGQEVVESNYAIIPGEVKAMAIGILKIEYNGLPQNIKNNLKEEMNILDFRPFATITTGKTFIGKTTRINLSEI
jgi:regulatory protein YycH of two-component signal transduction system YycFG